MEDDRRICESFLKEELLSPSMKRFQLSLISTEGNLIKSCLNFSDCLEILIDQNIILKIEYSDLLGLIREPINDPLSFSRDINIIQIQERENKTIAKLNFFPYVNIRTCSFFSIFCCSCIKNHKERKFKVVYNNIRLLNYLWMKRIMN